MIMRNGFKCTFAAAALFMTTAAVPGYAATALGISGNGDLSNNRTSVALTISVQCDAPGNPGDTKATSLTVHLFQSQGRLINIGIATAPVTCDGNSANMSIDVDAIPGLKFQPGPATIILKLTEQTSDATAAVTNSTTTESGGKVSLRP